MTEIDDKLVLGTIKNGGMPEGWAEVEIEFFQFENPGDHIAGELKEKTTQQMSGKPVGKYTVRTKSGNRISFLGSQQLDEKLKLVTLGRNILVIFDHEEPAKKEGQNPMRSYRVIVQTPQMPNK